MNDPETGFPGAKWSLHDTVGKKKRVKCTLVQAPRLCTGRTAHRGSRGIALLFLDYGTRRGWGVSVTSQPLFTPGKDPVPILQEAGWAPRPVWTGAENLAPTGFRFPDRPARSQSLYRLRYPAHSTIRELHKIPPRHRPLCCDTCRMLRDLTVYLLKWLRNTAPTLMQILRK